MAMTIITELHLHWNDERYNNMLCIYNYII
jgi:hypothetical protein